MARVIMVQGTMSNSGKSFLAAALCRIFKQDGYSCAPFKSQNMALNSYITQDGLEMGRAQVMQAEAAGIEPVVQMNPILLKPTSDTGSQVIVGGRVMGNMTASDYFRNKSALIPHVMEAYRSLAEQYDIIVIEGAGSPVELNLRSDDIVNMGMAKLANAPVLLVGDIDRGGVFAQLLGTLMLLEPEERERVRGLVVNKFRGDQALFADGVKILEERGGKPVAGVIPFLHCDLEDEDSLSEKLERQEAGLIDIAVVRLPRISNFTDFDVFSQYRGVTVRYIARPEEMGSPDMIVLPGTKSTIADMRWLRESGMEALVKKWKERGCLIFGICGGYQMLGRKISDPDGTEGGGTVRGMELLDMETVFCNTKQQTRTRGKFAAIEGSCSVLSGRTFCGYEIHMGQTDTKEQALTYEPDSGRVTGCYHGNVYGSYVHGIFDEKEISETLVAMLYKQKGLVYTQTAINRREYKEQQYDLLAEGVRQNLNMDFIYQMLNHNKASL